jgi:hypothetical protein
MGEDHPETAGSDQVFTISKYVINKVKTQRKYSKSSNKNFNHFEDKKVRKKFKGKKLDLST